MASRDVHVSAGRRAEAGRLVQQIEEINCGITGGIREVSACREHIAAAVAQAVRSLQFEDIATQSLATAGRHAQRIAAIQAESAQLGRILGGAAAAAGRTARRNAG